ncbi:hypothetical protein F4779DRAFT_214807 [Xylariaceae sp. FL0662B]|nr:hypothetical protein F4779DRAFT_214807 [Xylariaceae sp. FL0662B]
MMNHQHGPPRPPASYVSSDASSQYSFTSSLGSGSSVWSSSGSEAFVYREDPSGWDGIAGAVTRRVDERDDRRRRFAAHILSGPFAQFSSRSSRRSRRRRSSSGDGSRPNFAGGGGGGGGIGRPPFMPPPQQPQHHHQQHHHHQFPQRSPSAESHHYGGEDQFVGHDEFGGHGHGYGHGPPPPPPAHPGPPPPGFDGGFIQLGGGGGGGGPMGGPPPQAAPDPYWGHQEPGMRPAEVWD